MKIESDIGKREFDAPPMKKFTVDDAQNVKPVNGNALQARQKLIEETAQTQLPTSARNRIEYLLGIGKKYIDVKVEGEDGRESLYRFKTLRSKDMRAIILITQDSLRQKDPEYLFSVRVETLSRAIDSIDNTPIDEVLGISEADENERLEIRKAFFEEMDEHVIHYIYANYNKDVKEKTAQYAINTEEKAKEVVEDIKKS